MTELYNLDHLTELVKLSEIYERQPDNYEIAWPNWASYHNNRMTLKEESFEDDYHMNINVVVKQLHAAINKNKIPKDFSVLDIFCGTGGTLARIKREFPECHAYGIDVKIDEFQTAEVMKSSSIHVYKVPIQLMYQSTLSFDVITSFNSYRAFKRNLKIERANDNNKIILNQLETWIAHSSKFFIWEEGIQESRSLIK